MLKLNIFIIILTILLAAFMPSCAYKGDERDDVEIWMDWSGYWYYKGSENANAYSYAKYTAEKALSQDPENLMAKLVYGYCLLKLNEVESDNPRKQSSKRVFHEILENEPENYRAQMGLGLTYYKISSKYRKTVQVFERAVQSIDEILSDQARIKHLNDNDQKEKALDEELELAKRYQDFKVDLNRVIRYEYFPYELYASLAKKKENASLSDRKDALNKRLKELLNSIEKATLEMPFNHAVMNSDINKLKLLCNIAVEHYKKAYIKVIDESESRFKICLDLHKQYNREYFWIYEYMGMLYGIKATLYSEKPELQKQLYYLQKKYLVEFIKSDQAYERKRKERLQSDEFEKIQENQWVTMQMADKYQQIMLELIDESRVKRQSIIVLLIALLSNQLDDYDTALEWVDELKITEERMLSSSEITKEPFIHHFFRAKVLKLKSDSLEEDYPKLQRITLNLDTKESLEIPETVKSEVLAKHYAIWDTIVENLVKFKELSSLMVNEIERDEADEILLEAIERYPKLIEDYEK